MSRSSTKRSESFAGHNTPPESERVQSRLAANATTGSQHEVRLYLGYVRSLPHTQYMPRNSRRHEDNVREKLLKWLGSLLPRAISSRGFQSEWC